jgi:hypothetical protein
MAMAKNIVIGIVAVLLVIFIIRWLMGDSSKISGLSNVKIETTVYPSSDSTTSSTHTCNVANVPIQRWVNLIVSLYGRTLDVYIDGKLVRTCVLPGVAKIANNAPVYVTPLGGFSGYTSNIQYFGDALNPQEAYNIYRAGYGGSGISFPYELKIEFLRDGEQQGSLTI